MRFAVTRPGSRQFRSLLPPMVLILAMSGGCESSQKRTARLAEEARFREIQEKAERQKAEAEKPSEAVLAQIRSAVEAFMKEQHSQEEMDELVFTQLTPNLYLLGLKLKNPAGAKRSLTAERFRGEDMTEFYWVIDDATKDKMTVLSGRHGFAQEVEKVAAQASPSDWGDEGSRDSGSWIDDSSSGSGDSTTRRHGFHTASWLGPILLWHYLYGRPSPMGFSYRNPQRGFSSFAPGYRFTSPQAPFAPGVKDRLGSISAQTGGHSAVFLAGSAYQPKPMGSHPDLNTARIYSTAPHSGPATRVSSSSISRGGFGASGHSAGSSGSRGSSGSSSGS
jgi:hypothetical protein